MNRMRILMVLAVSVLAGIAVGCENANNANAPYNTNTNTNVNNANQARLEPTANSNNSNSGVSRSDVDRDTAKYRQQAKDLGRKVGDNAEDLWLWVKTRSALTTADDLRDSTIDVDVENNAVTLSGSVANATQKARAEELTKGIEGVKSVKNSLRIAADGSPAATSDKKAPATK